MLLLNRELWPGHQTHNSKQSDADVIEVTPEIFSEKKAPHWRRRAQRAATPPRRQAQL
jgi:hypothetical protein